MDQEIIQDEVFETALPESPAAEADAHQGTIEGVSSTTFPSGATSVDITVRSSNRPTVEGTMRVFLPSGFVEDIKVNPFDLPRSDENGKDQYASYCRSIACKEGTGTMQGLKQIALDAGRSGTQLGLSVPNTFSEWVENYSKLLTGLEVVFVRRPGQGDFKTRLEVSRIYSPSVIDNPGKKFKGIANLAWEQER